MYDHVCIKYHKHSDGSNRIQRSTSFTLVILRRPGQACASRNLALLRQSSAKGTPWERSGPWQFQQEMALEPTSMHSGHQDACFHSDSIDFSRVHNYHYSDSYGTYCN